MKIYYQNRKRFGQELNTRAGVVKVGKDGEVDLPDDIAEHYLQNASRAWSERTLVENEKIRAEELIRAAKEKAEAKKKELAAQGPAVPQNIVLTTEDNQILDSVLDLHEGQFADIADRFEISIPANVKKEDTMRKYIVEGLTPDNWKALIENLVESLFVEEE